MQKFKNAPQNLVVFTEPGMSPEQLLEPFQPMQMQYREMLLCTFLNLGIQNVVKLLDESLHMGTLDLDNI